MKDTADLPQEKKRPWKRAIVAGILSLVIPGIGHMLAYKVARGLRLGLIVLGLRLAFLAATQVFLFRGFAITLSVLLLAMAWITIDAMQQTRNATKDSLLQKLSILTRTGAIGAFLLIATMSDPGWFLHSVPELRGFRASSDSMCPTICVNERVLANMNAYSSKPLERGDVVLLSRPDQAALFIKRIVGLPGDTVSRQGDRILVNGRAVPLPTETCGLPIHGVRMESQIDFSSEIVPKDEFFVIGDNLPNSFDSRLPSFGPVRASEVRGEPLFLYWSPGKGRIGCAVH